MSALDCYVFEILFTFILFIWVFCTCICLALELWAAVWVLETEQDFLEEQAVFSADEPSL